MTIATNVQTAIKNYLSIVLSKEGDESSRILKLIMSLDELALLANKVEYTFDEYDYPEPPEQNYQAARDNISKFYPSLGYYNDSLYTSEGLGNSNLSIGDTIDDIADITRDLQEIMWRFENTSKDDALFHFQLTFQSHWGRHLRSLQWHLHHFLY